MLIWYASALARPTDPSELKDAAAEARAQIDACILAMWNHRPCAAPQSLAQASVVVAANAAVVEGQVDSRAAIDAWALSPEVARQWVDLIGHPDGRPSEWVPYALGTPAPTTTQSERTPLATGADGSRAKRSWYTVSLTGAYGHGIEYHRSLRTHQHLRARLTAARRGFTGSLGLRAGRDGHVFETVPLQEDAPIEEVRVWTRNTRAFGGLGYSGGSTHRLQVVAGPTLGTSGLGAGARERAARAGEWTWTEWMAGLEVQGRGRYQPTPRLRVCFEVRNGIERRQRTDHFLDEKRKLTTVQLRNLVLGELQIRTVSDLWWTLGLRAEGIVPLFQPEPGFWDWVGVESGLRWR